MLGNLGGCIYGARICVLNQPSDPAFEEIIEIRNGLKPQGLQLLQAWAEGNFQGVMPDSELSKQVLFMNLLRMPVRQNAPSLENDSGTCFAK